VHTDRPTHRQISPPSAPTGGSPARESGDSVTSGCSSSTAAAGTDRQRSVNFPEVGSEDPSAVVRV